MAEIASHLTPLTPEITTFRWARDGALTQTLTTTYILSEEKRPHLSKVAPVSIPVVDLKEPDDIIREKVVKACEEYGIFYLVNHGVDEELCRKVLSSIVEFFHLPPEQGRSQLHSTDFEQDVKIFNYQMQDGGKRVPGWSEALTHLWHPSDASSFMDSLPANPPQYRELIGTYAKEVGVLLAKLFGFFSEGLGLEKDALEKNLGEKIRYRMQANFYPPCPDPELTLGLPVHNDRGALALILQTEEFTGLHIIKDDKWMSVPPISNAFVCNIGDVLEILSNGKYKSVRHRAVTSKDKTRVSLATFMAPNKQSIIEPIKELLDEQHPPRYDTFLYANFHEKILRPWLHPNH